MLSDIEGIAAAVHGHGGKLFVDGAHGAHLSVAVLGGTDKHHMPAVLHLSINTPLLQGPDKGWAVLYVKNKRISKKELAYLEKIGYNMHSEIRTVVL